jgi:branched-chain amino acid transport system substrate-binding protein
VIAIDDDSSIDQAFAPYLAKNDVPVVGSGSTNAAFVTYSDFFPEGQTEDVLPTAVASAAKKVGATKVGLVYCSESPLCAELVAPVKTAVEKLGLTLAGSFAISGSAPNYTATCLALKEAGVTELYFGDAVAVAEKFATDCSTQSYSPVLAAEDGTVSPAFLKIPGWDNGMIGMQPDLPFFVTSSPAIKEMNAALKKYEPSVLSSPFYNEEVVWSWASGKLFEAAAKAGKVGAGGKPATSKELLTGLYDLHGATLGGLTPPLTYNRGRPNSVPCWFWMRSKNGKFVSPYGTKATCVSTN